MTVFGFRIFFERPTSTWKLLHFGSAAAPRNSLQLKGPRGPKWRPDNRSFQWRYFRLSMRRHVPLHQHKRSAVFVLSSTQVRAPRRLPPPQEAQFEPDGPPDRRHGCRFEHRSRKGASSNAKSTDNQRPASQQPSVREKMAGAVFVFPAGVHAGDGVELLGSYPELGSSSVWLLQVWYCRVGAVGPGWLHSLAAVHVADGQKGWVWLVHCVPCWSVLFVSSFSSLVNLENDPYRKNNVSKLLTKWN